MKIFKNLFKRSKKATLRRPEGYYLELDLIPLYNWEKCGAGKFEYIQKGKIKPDLKSDFHYYELLFNKYLKAYGLDEKYEKYLNDSEKYAKLIVRYLRSGDAFLKNEIRILEVEIKKNDPMNYKGMTIDESLIWLSKFIGYRVNKRDITVAEYKEMLKAYGTGNKEK